MKNFIKISCYTKTTTKTTTSQGNTISESEKCTEIKVESSSESNSSLKSMNLTFGKMFRFILSLEGLMSFTAYFKDLQFINPLIILIIDSLINITTSCF